MLLIVAIVEKKILGTRLRIGGQTEIARSLHLLERVVAAEVDDVYRRVRHFRNSDRAVNTFGFSASRPRQRMIFRSGLSFGQSTFDQDIYYDAVLCVHADQPAAFTGNGHCFEYRSIVDKKHAGIGHEEFETRDALVDETPDLGHTVVRQIGEYHVEA